MFLQEMNREKIPSQISQYGRGSGKTLFIFISFTRTGASSVIWTGQSSVS